MFIKIKKGCSARDFNHCSIFALACLKKKKASSFYGSHYSHQNTGYLWLLDIGANNQQMTIMAIPGERVKISKAEHTNNDLEGALSSPSSIQTHFTKSYVTLSSFFSFYISSIQHPWLHLLYSSRGVYLRPKRVPALLTVMTLNPFNIIC